MSSSESQEALSDPLPRIYSCFCDKIFTTYPGIYLHLKSKHANLFQKYKKLKITKLFKKIKGQNNSEIFKLDKLTEKDIASNTFYLKKNKLNNKKNNTNLEDKIVLLQDDSEEQRQIKRNNYTKSNNFDPRPPPVSFDPRYYPPTHRDFMERIGNNPYYPPMPNPFFGFPYCPPPQAHPTFTPFLDPPIKRTFQEFFDFSEANGLSNKAELRNVLYRLMIFIDENYQAANDPRVKGDVIFSYCDLFSPRFIASLMNQYISQRVAKTQKDPFQSEVRYLKQYVFFLQERKLLKLEPQFKPQFKPQYKPQLKPESKSDKKLQAGSDSEVVMMEKFEVIHD